MNKWISVKERLPLAGEMIWRFIPGRNIDCVRLADPRDWLSRWQPNWTHWMPAEIPAPPKTEAEEAFAKLLDNYAKNLVKADWIKGFNAGLEAGRKT